MPLHLFLIIEATNYIISSKSVNIYGDFNVRSSDEKLYKKNLYKTECMK